MRIVIDVTPLGQPRTGIGNYLLGMLRGTADAAAGRHELVAFAVVGPRGAPRIREALAGLPVEQRVVVVGPSSQTWRTAWSRLGFPKVERLAGKLDVFHFSDWMYPAQRGGLRTTTVYDLWPLHHPEWVAPLTRRMHGRKYANAARTSDLIFAISEFTAEDVAETLDVPRERIPVAYPGVDERYTPEGPESRAREDRTSWPWQRSSRVRTCPRWSRRTHSSARSGPSSSSSLPVTGPLGRAGARGRRRDRARVRARRAAARALPRRERLRLSVTLRGLWDPGRRGDGVRNARGRRHRIRRSTSPAATRQCARTRRAPRPSPRASKERWLGEKASSRVGSNTRSASHGARAARPIFKDS